MDRRDLLDLLNQVAEGSTTPDDALSHMQVESVSNIGFAQVDNTRGLRQGVSEVIYGSGKTSDQIEAICTAMAANGQQRILITRLNPEKYQRLSDDLGVEYHETARLGIIGGLPEPDGNGAITQRECPPNKGDGFA